MDEKDKGRLLLSLIGILILLPISIINGTYHKVLAMIFSTIIVGLIFFLIGFLFYNDKREFKKTKRYFDSLKQKADINVLEELYMLTFKNKSERIVRDKLNNYKVKNIGYLGLNTQNVNKINLSFIYNDFNVSLILSNNLITYSIDTPYKYDHYDDNKTFESKNVIKINICEFETLDNYLDMLVELIKNIKEEINDFVSNHNVSNVINGKLLSKYKYSLNYIKTLGYIYSILPPFIGVIFIYVLFLDISNVDATNKTFLDAYIGIIISIITVILTSYFTVHGIDLLKRSYLYVKDVNLSRVSTIKEKPMKIKIISDRLTRNDYRRLIYIKLYYKNVTLFVLFSTNEYVNKLENKKKAILECMNVNQELKYLSKSKIVILGGERYTSIVKKHLV